MRPRRISALLASLIAFCAPIAGRAQYIDLSGENEWAAYGSFDANLDILPSDARMVPVLLRMDEDQRGSFEDLFQSYLAERVEAGRKFRDYYVAISGETRLDPQNRALREQLLATGERLRAYAKSLREQLMVDTRLLLEPVQDARWKTLDRALIRVSIARERMDAACPAQRADVTRLALMALGDRQPTAELLDAIDRYESEVGPVVDAYDAWLKEVIKGNRDYEVLEGEDPDAVYHMEDRRRLRKIADANVTHAEWVVRAMSEDAALRFRDLFYAQALQARLSVSASEPHIEKAIMQAHEAARGTALEQAIETLIRDRMVRLAAIREQDLAQARDEEARALERRELSVFGEGARQQRWRRPSAEASKADAEFFRSLRAVFSAEQLATLPPPLGKTEIVPPTFE